jgi:hypothetical protein
MKAGIGKTILAVSDTYITAFTVIKLSSIFSFTGMRTSDVNAWIQAEKHRLLVMMTGCDLMLKELGLYLLQSGSVYLHVIHETVSGWMYPTWVINYKDIE